MTGCGRGGGVQVAHKTTAAMRSAVPDPARELAKDSGIFSPFFLSISLQLYQNLASMSDVTQFLDVEGASMYWY